MVGEGQCPSRFLKPWRNAEVEQVIRKYFRAWLEKDDSVLRDVFAENILYSECYGPEYHGIDQVLQWFSDWNRKGSVLEWPIKRVIQQGNTLVAEWYFRCDYEGSIGGFDGVTIADFDENLRIIKLLEFQSKAEHEYPYD